MATRPVYEVYNKPPYFHRRDTEFVFYSGFAIEQKKRSVRSLHAAYTREFPNRKLLEISRASEVTPGAKLSAFNLMIVQKNGLTYSVESAFQAGKCFENGGPYDDLLYKSSAEAKKDPRLRNSGKIIAFRFKNLDFPTEPKTYFYDWLYINALNTHPEYHEQLMQYDGFTDIMFNPQKQINCQAEAAAVFVSLRRLGLLEKALESKESFLATVFGRTSPDSQEEEYVNITLDDLL